MSCKGVLLLRSCEAARRWEERRARCGRWRGKGASTGEARNMEYKGNAVLNQLQMVVLKTESGAKRVGETSENISIVCG